MSNRLVEPLSQDTKIVKPRLVKTINSAIEEINHIHRLYDDFFKSPDGKKPALANEVEEKLNEIGDIVDDHKKAIEAAKNEVLATRDDLLKKEPGTKKSKVDKLNKKIDVINQYNAKVEKEIAPYINEKQSIIDEIEKDIRNKRNEVDSLLSDATVRSLSQNYREAMRTYGSPTPIKKVDKNGSLKTARIHTGLSYGAHFAKFAGSYALFIGPLLIIAFSFLYPEVLEGLLGVAADETFAFTGTDYLAFKLTISLPLLWVSWFGQKNISRQKRLFEEYNHKFRVVQMYLLFTAKEDTYKLRDDSRIQLEETLLNTIARNPNDIYGDDGTLLDKFFLFLNERKELSVDLKKAKIKMNNNGERQKKAIAQRANSSQASLNDAS